jgi:hypothetical protein
LATGFERADDFGLEDAALFFPPAKPLEIRDLVSFAGLGRRLFLTALGVLARAGFACFFAFPLELFFFRADMDRLKTVNEARKANETPSPRQARRIAMRACIGRLGRLFDFSTRTG